MVKTKVIYHEADLDGVTSAAIFLLEGEYRGDDISLLPYDYHKDFPKKKTDGHTVFMVDVSCKCSKLLEAAKDSAEFYLIDHHKSFHDDFLLYCSDKGIEYVENSFGIAKRYVIKDYNFEYYYSDGYSGCELVMRLFSNSLGDKSKELINILGQYDTWRDTNEKKYNFDKDWDKVVLPIQYSLRAYMNPESISKVLYNLDNGGSKFGIDKLISEGNTILNYLRYTNKIKLDTFSFSFEYQGMRLLAMNTNEFNSFVFDSYWNPELYDAMLAFNFTGKDWRVSLYTTKDVDILKIATFFGGGGHRKACGFRIPHNQLVFRNGKLEIGVLHVMDIAQLPQSYKGLDLNEIKKIISEQSIQIVNMVDEAQNVIDSLDSSDVDMKSLSNIMYKLDKEEIKMDLIFKDFDEEKGIFEGNSYNLLEFNEEFETTVKDEIPDEIYLKEEIKAPVKNKNRKVIKRKNK